MIVIVSLLALIGIGWAGVACWALGTRQERARAARWAATLDPPKEPGKRGGMRLRSVRLTK